MNIKAVSSSQYHISANNIQSDKNIGEKGNKSKSIEVNKPLFSQNRKIQFLENQKARLEEQIGKIKESDCDSKIKQERITELRKQIQEIDAQIQQAKLESITKKDELKESTKNQEDKINEKKKNDNENKGGIDSSRVEHLTKIDNIYSDIKGLSKVRTDLKGKARVRKTEIELDSSRGANVSYKVEELVETDGRIKEIEKSMMEKGNEIQKEIKKSNDEENNKEKNEKIDESKIEDSNKYEKAKSDKDKNRKSLDLYI